MSNHHQEHELQEAIHNIFTRLTQGQGEHQWTVATQLAEASESRDHWLGTDKTDPAVRLFLSAAAALSMRHLKGDPYKCAVLARDLAESVGSAR